LNDITQPLMFDAACLAWHEEIEVLDDPQAGNHFSKGERQVLTGNVNMQEEQLEGDDHFLHSHSESQHHSADYHDDSCPSKH
jgi:hypothetical protein